MRWALQIGFYFCAWKVVRNAVHTRHTKDENAMKKRLLAILSAGLMVAIACQGTDNIEQEQAARKQKSGMDSIRRGAYLVAISGCNDCHSPKVMTPQGPALDTSRLLSGYNPAHPFEGYDERVASGGQFVLFNGDNTAFAGPWGVSYGANITPHETGIGNWSLDQFKIAMRQGKWKGLEGSRTLLPPMPWQNYRDMTDEDVGAIFAYLRSIKPVENLVPAPKPPMK